jgi:DNA polymerase-3 subunit beta
MNLSIQRKCLHAGLQSATRAVTSRSSLPILANVLLEAVGGTLRLRGTDLELTIERILDGVDVKTPGGACLPAKTLCDIVAALPDGLVTLSTDEQHVVTITCGKSVYRINSLPAVEFPPTPEVALVARFVIGTDILRRALQRTLMAVSRDDTRPVLTGVLIAASGDVCRFVATDTHRLAIDTSPLVDAPEVAAIIPGRAMRELVPLLADAEFCRMELGEHEATFSIGATKVTTRLIEGKFPNYERVIPKEHTFKLTLDAAELKRTVKRASIVAREDANRLKFFCDSYKLDISSSSGQLGECSEEVACEHEGDADLEFHLNATYFLDTLDAVGGDTVSLEGTGALSPMVVRDVKDESGLVVIMPMQAA